MTLSSRRFGLVLFGAALLLPTGCGWQTKITVTGKVSFAGRSLAMGSVSIVGADGVISSGAISPDGTYEVANVMSGVVKIGVSSPKPYTGAPTKVDPSATSAPPIPDKNLWFAIPEKYADPESSGLKADLKTKRVHDISLE